MKIRKILKFILWTILVVLFCQFGCSEGTRSLEVTATAYTSSPRQTDATPSIAAWGDKLKPGMKVIAVSRDLLDMGLTRGVKVSIDGLKGKYTVLDKMNRRWKKKIDIYMGKNVKRARAWGKRKVVIHWRKASS